ncbi:hypothetical protein DID88_010059 [Monilinia fructigena]|uniref:DUF1996 domain-containing protein n=1 Tax=Monilinia fructigena TaxID=38457 RepID=A0A395INJ3_9HELO|nr:hypothetical protein DID88_010059 [Monilinia fructigena]
MRLDVHFPSCYNPAAGLTNYKTNMDWPTKGNCPEGWVHTPHIFYEVYYNTPLFDSQWTPGQGKQPFILSNGDPTGYSLHADFISGWDVETLQQIIDNCDAGDSGMDKMPSEASTVTPTAVAGDDVISSSVITYGGRVVTSIVTVHANTLIYKTISVTANQAVPTGSSLSTGVLATVSGYTYAGCYADQEPSRSLSGVEFADLGLDAVSNTACVAYCSAKDIALRELSTEDSVSAAVIACPDVCGGALALSVYSTGGTGKKEKRMSRHLYRHLAAN